MTGGVHHLALPKSAMLRPIILRFTSATTATGTAGEEQGRHGKKLDKKENKGGRATVVSQYHGGDDAILCALQPPCYVHAAGARVVTRKGGGGGVNIVQQRDAAHCRSNCGGVGDCS